MTQEMAKDNLPRGEREFNVRENEDVGVEENIVESSSEAENDNRHVPVNKTTQSWDRFIKRLRAELGEDLYSSWFARMELVSFEADRLQVSVPTLFLRSWIQTHYCDKIIEIYSAEVGAVERLDIEVRARGAHAKVPLRQREEKSNWETGGAGKTVRKIDPKTGKASVASRLERGSPLDANLTFDNFILGPSNALSHAAALRVAGAMSGGSISFNPLFLHSAAGLGKTHLLNAICWNIRQQSPEKKVLYLTAERFMVHFIEALKAKDTLSFKEYIQGVDILLIDDFQFLQGPTTHQEFCHTFNTLVDSKRQIVIAADVPPSQLDNIDERMRSRLAGGLVVDIEPAEFELRQKILKYRLQKAQERDPGIDISEEVLSFIAHKIKNGGRELEGALTRIIADQQLRSVPMTVDMAAIAIRDLIRTEELRRVRIDDIQRVIGKHFNVAKSDLLSPRRARSIVHPRQIGMYLAKTMTTRSLPEIGRRFGNRDHSTVLYAVRKIGDLVQIDEKVAQEVSLLTRMLEK